MEMLRYTIPRTLKRHTSLTRVRDHINLKLNYIYSPKVQPYDFLNISSSPPVFYSNTFGHTSLQTIVLISYKTRGKRTDHLALASLDDRLTGHASS